MCGIAGIIGRADAAERVRGMVASIAHRGPDATGLWSDFQPRPITLGHARLAIIDLSEAANQPIEKDGMVLAFNGEIYNYRELRSELVSQGVNFLHGLGLRGHRSKPGGPGDRPR